MDERLRQLGIGVNWSNVEDPETNRRKLTFIFWENDKKTSIDENLTANKARDCYSSVGVVSDKLAERGFDGEIQVALDAKAKTSTIDFKVNGEPFRIVKPYN